MGSCLKFYLKTIPGERVELDLTLPRSEGSIVTGIVTRADGEPRQPRPWFWRWTPKRFSRQRTAWPIHRGCSPSAPCPARSIPFMYTTARPQCAL